MLRRSAAAIEPTEDVGHVRESVRHTGESVRHLRESFHLIGVMFGEQLDVALNVLVKNQHVAVIGVDALLQSPDVVRSATAVGRGCGSLDPPRGPPRRE